MPRGAPASSPDAANATGPSGARASPASRLIHAAPRRNRFGGAIRHPGSREPLAHASHQRTPGRTEGSGRFQEVPVHTYTYPTHAPRPKMLAVAATCLVVGAGASLGISALANDDDSASVPAVAVPAQQSPAPGV